jgi:hypothetical protein
MSGSDPQSPTTLIMAYLASKGLPPTPQNVSRVLQMNAQQPGLIPGLVNQAPPPPDAQATATGQQTNQQPIQPQQPQQQMPTPPMPPAPQAAPSASAPQAPAPQAQAPQQDGGSNWLTALMQSILGGGAAAFRGGGGSGGAEPMPPDMPMPSRGPIDVPPNMIQGPAPLQLPGPQGQLQSPQNPQQVVQPQIGGPGNNSALPAPGEKPAIAMPDQTSGPTIELPHRSGTAEPIDWSKVLGEVMPLLKRTVR